MSKPFDTTLNALIDPDPQAWADYFSRRLGLPVGRATVEDTDLSITLQADKLLRIDGPRPFALHLEFEASGRRTLPDDMMVYNNVAGKILRMPVLSVAILLRREANRRNLTGVRVRPGRDGRAGHTFAYQVIRVWQEPIEGFVSSGAMLAPLALLTDEAAVDPIETVKVLEQRLRTTGVPPQTIRDGLGLGFVLGGMRYHRSLIREMHMAMSGILEQSISYQMILEEGEKKGLAKGRVEGLAEGQVQHSRTTLLKQGTARFGAPTAKVERAIMKLADLERLDRMTLAVLTVSDWKELLATA